MGGFSFEDVGHRQREVRVLPQPWSQVEHYKAQDHVGHRELVGGLSLSREMGRWIDMGPVLPDQGLVQGLESIGSDRKRSSRATVGGGRKQGWTESRPHRSAGAERVGEVHPSPGGQDLPRVLKGPCRGFRPSLRTSGVDPTQSCDGGTCCTPAEDAIHGGRGAPY